MGPKRRESSEGVHAIASVPNRACSFAKALSNVTSPKKKKKKTDAKAIRVSHTQRCNAFYDCNIKFIIKEIVDIHNVFVSRKLNLRWR